MGNYISNGSSEYRRAHLVVRRTGYVLSSAQIFGIFMGLLGVACIAIAKWTWV